MIPTKAHIRRGIQIHRDSLAPETVAHLAQSFADQLELVAAWRAAKTPALYVSFGGEASTRVILENLFKAGRFAALPRVENGDIVLHRATSFADLAPGRFGIGEPRADLPVVPTATVDLFVIPGVAFDRRGHRIGFGKGFYDRLLAHAAPGAKVVGLAYGFQLVHHIPEEGHDRPVDLVVTPHGAVACEK